MYGLNNGLRKEGYYPGLYLALFVEHHLFKISHVDTNTFFYFLTKTSMMFFHAKLTARLMAKTNVPTPKS